MENLEILIKQRIAELQSQLKVGPDAQENMNSWANRLLDSMEKLPQILKLNLGLLKPEYISGKSEYELLVRGDDEKKNTLLMSALYGCAANFIQKGLFPRMAMTPKFKPSDLSKGIHLLSDIKGTVHTIYSSYFALVGRRDDLTMTKAIYPVDASTNAIANFLGEYSAAQQMRYISAYKQVLDSLAADPTQLEKDKERILKEFEPDAEFVKQNIMAHIGKNWGDLISMTQDWNALAKTYLSSFTPDFKLNR